jgi:SAM-dependent methyltransferase
MSTSLPLGSGAMAGTARRVRRWVAAFRRRATGSPQPPPQGGAGKRAKGACRVCHGQRVRSRTVSHVKFDRELKVRICRDCGHVGIPGNRHDYTQTRSTDELGLAPRVGTEDVPGREFGMAQLAVDVLGRRGLSVLVYGAGRSVDNKHIARLEPVSRVAIGDVFKARDDAEFVDVSKPARERFDVVIASEVIEHFVDPRKEFRRLFSYVADDGLLVCSTNLYDGGNLNKQAYIWGRGHVSYYSPEALRILARLGGFQLDLRVPYAAAAGVGPRKRYVLLSRSADVMERIVHYFGRHQYAPSERAHRLERRMARAAGKQPADG